MGRSGVDVPSVHLPSWAFEKKAHLLGRMCVAGVDEAGRGPLAGPVVAAACILPLDYPVFQINDSKAVSASLREKIYRELTEDPSVIFAIGMADVAEIDEINILQATLRAMERAVLALRVPPDHVLIDGPKAPALQMNCETLVRGDSLSYSIAAASIIAKVTRDHLMCHEIHLKWPAYGFNQHKGYGTKAHLEALMRLGPSPVHRKTFEPVRSMHLS